MLHGPAAKLDDDNAAIRKSRLGFKFFFFYGAIYVGFIGIGVFYPGLM